jgi:hypothetical protein
MNLKEKNYKKKIKKKNSNQIQVMTLRLPL